MNILLGVLQMYCWRRGGVDYMVYSYDGNRVTEIDNEPDGTDFYGRTGYPAATGSYSWDAAGRMTADSSRGLQKIDYDHRNLPTLIRHSNGTLESHTYTASGLLRAITTVRRNGQVTRRVYEGDRVFDGDPAPLPLQYSYFNGGYFDGSGGVHYLHNDYQGSVVMVTDSAGMVEQRTSYYPYGEPHRNPAGQPILYGGKERLASTDDYAYGARRHHAAAIMWPTPDSKASDYLNLSPYAFCRSNPIMYVEIDGDFSFKWMADFSRWMTRISSKGKVRPVQENIHAKNGTGRFYYDEIESGKDGLTITRHIKFSKSAATKLQTAGFATAGAGYLMTLSVVGAGVGASFTIAGSKIAVAGAWLELGVDLLNFDWTSTQIINIGWSGTKVALNWGVSKWLKKVLPNKDLGSTILRDGANLKLNGLETLGDTFKDHKQNQMQEREQEEDTDQIDIEIETELQKLNKL